MNIYDLAQFERMTSQIDHFCSKELGLGDLIADLTFLRDALTDIDRESERRFTDNLLDLESVYSYMLEKDLKEPTKEHSCIIEKAVDNILELIQELKGGAQNNI